MHWGPRSARGAADRRQGEDAAERHGKPRRAAAARREGESLADYKQRMRASKDTAPRFSARRTGQSGEKSQRGSWLARTAQNTMDRRRGQGAPRAPRTAAQGNNAHAAADPCLEHDYAVENYATCCAHGGYKVEGHKEVCRLAKAGARRRERDQR